MKEHPVVGDDLVGLVELAAAALRIPTAQVARWQHSLHTHLPEHGLGGQAHLREEPLRATAGEVEDRLGVACRANGVSNDGHVVGVFDVEQGPGRLLGQVARHLLVHKVNDLLAQRRTASGGGRLGRLRLG